MISTAITAFFEMVKQAFSTHQSSIEHTLETSVVKDKKDLKKACNQAEKLILLTDKYKNFMTEADLKKYNNYKIKFFKFN